MQAVERLEGLVTELNERITTEAEQQKAAIQNLRDEINNGADAASLNRIADELEASIDRVASIVPDTASTGDATEGGATETDAVDTVATNTGVAEPNGEETPEDEITNNG